MKNARWHVWTLVTLLWVASALHLTWILLDKSVWPWDPAWYGEVTLSLYDQFGKSTSQWLGGLMTAFGFKAPAIAWFGEFFLPLRFVVGSIEAALLLLSAGSGIIAALCCYGVVERLWPEARLARIVALLAVLAAPLQIGLSHQYFVESFQLAVVALVFYLSLTPLTLASMLSMSGLVALGLLIKITTPAYLLLPGALVLHRLWKERKVTAGNRLYTFVAFLFAAVLCVGAAAWYYSNWEQIKAFAKLATDSAAVERYGSRNPFFVKLNFWAFHSSLAFSYSPFTAKLFAALAGLSLLLLLRRKGRSIFFDFEAWAVCGSVAQASAILVLFSLQINEETRYLLPILPYLSLLAGYITVSLGTLVGIATAAGLLAQAVFAFGVSLRIPTVQQRSPWLLPYDPSSRERDVLTKMVSKTCPQPLKYIVIGQERASFNANSASLYSMKRVVYGKQPLRCYYTSLGYAEANVDAAWKRLEELKPAYIVFRNDIRVTPDDPFNAVTIPVQERLAASPNWKRSEILGKQFTVYEPAIAAQ